MKNDYDFYDKYDNVQEVVFVGCSNSGKSTLINQLQIGRKEAARTSKKLGKTQSLNFYKIGEGSKPLGFLVDSPGYGYTWAPVKVK